MGGNKRKTVLIVTGRYTQQINIELAGITLNEVETFKYLGSKIPSDEKCSEDINKETRQAKITFNENVRLLTSLNVVKAYRKFNKGLRLECGVL